MLSWTLGHSMHDVNGSVEATYSYDAFGNTTATSSINNPFQYTGREGDSETGLYYYRARYYEPTAGRFISADPIRFGGGVNFYAYSENAPTNFIDPSGKKIGVTGDYLSYMVATIYLNNSPTAAAIIKELVNSPDLYLVHAEDGQKGNQAPPEEVTWNPHSGNCGKHGTQSPALMLLHELIHVWQRKHGIPRYVWKDGYLVDNWEEPATSIVNIAAGELGEPLKDGYFDSSGHLPTATPIPPMPIQK